MKTLQLALPPKFGFSIVMLALVIWSIQHPSQATAENSLATGTGNTKVESTAAWKLPVKPPAKLINNYLAPNYEYGPGHRGIDFQVTKKQKIYAPLEGEIFFAGLVADKPVLAIKHIREFISSYEPVCSVLLVGQKVRQGQLIGQACGSIKYQSHCQKVFCLHYGIRSAGKYLSPFGVAGALPPSHTVSDV